MRLIRFEQGGRFRWGVRDGSTVRPLAADGDGEAEALSVLRGTRDEAAGGACPELSGVRLQPPLVSGATIYCIGLNYRSHVEEVGRDLPPQPSVFIRTHDSVVGAGEPLIRPRVSAAFDFEGELALVIGAPARHVTEERAMAHVAGYTCFMDGSVRDYQKHSVTAGKNFWRTGACGPELVTSDEVGRPDRVGLRTRLNGEVVQNASTEMLIYPLARIVAYLSEITELRTGDIVATGTPSGVGARRTPPLWMKAGDRLEVEIDGVGLLSNPVVDE
jgi:2-keto-4-pentenoate hydratase/2-oxohepta-3-ene-1,7-dioic acid hydratase in catechol pathway